MLNCIIVGLGGFVGAVIRYLIGLIPMNPQSGFPTKTFLVNIAGAFMIGSVVAIGAKKDWNPQLILFLKAGICAKASEPCMLTAALSLEEQSENMGWKPYNQNEWCIRY